MTKNNYANHKELYEEQIKPLIQQVLNICNNNKIPMFFSIAVNNTKKGTEYQSELLDPDFLDIELTDDKFKDFLNLMNGFSTYYPTENIVEEMEFEAD